MTPQNSDTRSYTYDPLNIPLQLDRSSTKYKRNPVYSPNEWLLEIGSSLLALGMLVGIGCIFLYMDDEPLSKWDISISLSATVAILTTGCTTALMYAVSAFIGQLKWLHFKKRSQKLSHLETFDEASRGIWGSILLLTTVKPNLATIGAVVTILRLAFSPFTQQVILIEQRNVITADNNVTFGFAHSYSRNISGDLANAGAQSIPQDPNMQSAIVQGLYGITTPAQFSCPGACRWKSSYITLGFKTSCKNVTEETLSSQDCNPISFPNQQNRVSNNSAICNMTTPNGLGLSTRFQYTEMATSYYMSATSLLEPFGEPPENHTLPEITRFAVYRSSPDTNFFARNINVTECSLYLTAYEYTDARANGSDFSFGQTREVDFGLDGEGDNPNPWNLAAQGSRGFGISVLSTNETKASATNTNIDIPSLNISYASLAAIENFFLSPTIINEWVIGSFDNQNIGLAAALAGAVDIPDRFNQMASAMTS